MINIRKETNSLGEVAVPADKLWGTQTQRSLEMQNSFCIIAFFDKACYRQILPKEVMFG